MSSKLAGREFTHATALAVVTKKGLSVDHTKKVISRTKPTQDVGNGTLGAIDYLRRDGFVYVNEVAVRNEPWSVS